jgi:predicted transcriptional regulator
MTTPKFVDITTAQKQILDVIGASARESKTISVSEIAKAVGKTSATVYTILNGDEKRGKHGLFKKVPPLKRWVAVRKGEVRVQADVSWFYDREQGISTDTPIYVADTKAGESK